MTQGLLVLAGMTDCLMSFKDMNFVPSEADPDVWMRPAKYESCYEYSAAYVDDLAIASKTPKEITDQLQHDRIPSKPPGAEPPRDAKDSGSARSHSTHLETSSSDQTLMGTYMETHTVPSYMCVKCARRMLRMPNFTRATHAQLSLSNFPWQDSDFGERTRSRGTT